MAKQVRPVRPVPKIGNVRLPQIDSENSPKWAVGIAAIISSILSIMLVLGLESVGAGIGEIMQSNADSTRIESLTTAQMLQSMQNSNVVLQNQLLIVQEENRRLKEEARELRTILKYEAGVIVTPAISGEPTLSLLPTSESITLPTKTPDAVELFENGVDRKPTPMTPTPTATR